MVGTVMNGLSHLHGCTERGQFIISLIRGLGGNLNMKSQQEFTKEVVIYKTKLNLLAARELCFGFTIV